MLNELVQEYRSLVERGELDEPGWQRENITFAAVLDQSGNLTDIVDLREEVERGKKKVRVPRMIGVPARKKRSSGIAANCLADNATYVFGLDTKGKPERAIQCFEAFRTLHVQMFEHLESPVAYAISQFVQMWDPSAAAQHPVLAPWKAELEQGANVLIQVGDTFATEDPMIREQWNHVQEDQSDMPVMQCLITGETGPIAVTHPNVMGIYGAQSSGAGLVTFNRPAFESYGQDGGQGRNAPVSVSAAFAYTQALNWLVRSDQHHIRLGEMTIVFWAEENDNAASAFMWQCFSDMDEVSQTDLKDAMAKLVSGNPVNWAGFPIAPSNHYSILGISPNAARLSIRFYMRDTLGHLAENMMRHYSEIQIAHAPFELDVLPLWRLLKETVNQKSKDKNPAPHLAGDMLRAIMTGQRYPSTFFEQTEVRLRAESGNVCYGKVANIKAYLMRNGTNLVQEAREVLTVELNEQSNYPPYVMGRLFAVLEALQRDAHDPSGKSSSEAGGAKKTTIRDRYFTSACATPAVVFPPLIKLAQAHLKKVDQKKEIYYNRMITELMNKMTANFPVRLSLQDQGIFQMGYYHEVQRRYTKKEDK